MPDTGAPFFIPFADPTDLVRDWPDLSEDVALAIVAALENIPVTQKKIEAFTGDGTWTVPAGVTHAIAHMLGGGGGPGGGTGGNQAGGKGGDSSVAFASGTVTSVGGTGGGITNVTSNKPNEAENSGRGATGRATEASGSDSTYVTVSSAVTPAESITVTVGAGGTAPGGGGTGGSGYVFIEYFEEV